MWQNLGDAAEDRPRRIQAKQRKLEFGRVGDHPYAAFLSDASAKNSFESPLRRTGHTAFCGRSHHMTGNVLPQFFETDYSAALKLLSLRNQANMFGLDIELNQGPTNWSFIFCH